MVPGRSKPAPARFPGPVVLLIPNERAASSDRPLVLVVGACAMWLASPCDGVAVRHVDDGVVTAVYHGIGLTDRSTD
jgi:hypothetical protein